jgi:hypothetical protein
MEAEKYIIPFGFNQNFVLGLHGEIMRNSAIGDVR